ncbi:hypothetical protein NQ317_003489 [Molorchus minor]|uniref:Uncharacterized protein n=1 Tax=Molorchus minor TaxID=1323400 RepID=A0ABQ9J227_9CUCU|nr:hypothetical protein NQ317_003489 [Molorchus minor]
MSSESEEEHLPGELKNKLLRFDDVTKRKFKFLGDFIILWWQLSKSAPRHSLNEKNLKKKKYVDIYWKLQVNGKKWHTTIVTLVTDLYVEVPPNQAAIIFSTHLLHIGKLTGFPAFLEICLIGIRVVYLQLVWNVSFVIVVLNGEQDRAVAPLRSKSRSKRFKR